LINYKEIFGLKVEGQRTSIDL